MPLRNYYLTGIIGTLAGILIIFLLNIATPLEFVIAQFEAYQEHGNVRWPALIFSRLLIFCCLAALACTPYLLIMHRVLAPVSVCLEWIRQGEDLNTLPPDMVLKARQRLINLPFIMVPWMMVLWGTIPVVVFSVAVMSGFMDMAAAIIFFLRSLMVGAVSAAIVFFRMESHSRKQVIPLFFPDGELARIHGTTRLSISLRIRAFFRIGSLMPLANVVMTLYILYWQVDSDTVTAKAYGLGVLIFSLVVFLLFFMASGLLNRLFARSISDPLSRILGAVEEIRQGNLDTRVKVVSNDEVGVLGDATNQMIRELREKEMLRDTFGRYVAPEVRDEIISGRIPLDGEYRNVTVMFADLRDFTPMTESRDPKQVVLILNAYFREMSQAIQQHGGLILQFLGDEIYAVFGAPVECEHHGERAVSAALEMEKRLTNLNRSFRQKAWPVLSHGIGIHTGPVVAANIGSPDRLSYLLVGNTVNLASRLQTQTRELNARIVVSAETARHLPVGMIRDSFSRQEVRVKGRQTAVEIYQNPAKAFKD